MLALKLGMSLVSSNKGGAAAWTPTDETSLEAWYQRGVGIVAPTGTVRQWNDSSSNSHTMVQATTTEQPAYSNGVLTFTAADVTNLESASDIVFTGEFTIGFIAHPSTSNLSLLGHNGAAFAEFIKYASLTKMTFKLDGTTQHINLSSGTFGDDYIVITRDSSNVIRLYKNGVLEIDTATLSGTADINALGVRAVDKNPFDGTMEEFQFYSSTSAALTANVTARLASL